VVGHQAAVSPGYKPLTIKDRQTVISEANEEEQKGASYIRWGRKVCESNATLVYRGILYHMYMSLLLYCLIY